MQPTVTTPQRLPRDAQSILELAALQRARHLAQDRKSAFAVVGVAQFEAAFGHAVKAHQQLFGLAIDAPVSADFVGQGVLGSEPKFD